MSVLEIKGGLLDLISKVNDKDLLMKIHEILNEMVENNMSKTDFWDELTSEQQEELNKAIEASNDEGNLVDHEEVIKKYKEWLKQ